MTLIDTQTCSKKDSNFIDISNWKKFTLNEIFTTIQRGNQSGVNKTETRQHKDDLPLIGAKKINNGEAGYISKEIYQKNKNTKIYRNVITIGNTGNGGVAFSFYQKYDCLASSTVTVLHHEKLNMYNALFITSLLNNYHDFFGHSRAITNTRIEKIKIPLPAIKKEDQYVPDWEYMEKYIKEIVYECIDTLFKEWYD